MSGSRRSGPRTVFFVGACALGTAIALSAYAAHVLRSVELSSVDKRFSIRGSTGQPKDVVLVAVDEATFSGFDNRLQWPFPRRYHAKVIDRIVAGDPKAIAIDIQFTEPTDEADDGALLEAVERAGNVVLAAAGVDEKGNTNVFGGPAVVRRVGAHVGFSVFPTDSHGVIRQVAESVEGLATFCVAAVAVADGKPVPPAGAGSHWIDFAGPSGTVKTYSYSDVYSGKVQPGAFRDKFVVIGASDPTLQDIHATSTGLMAGPEVQANAIETAYQGYPLQSAAGWLNVLLVILLGMLPLSAVRFGLVYTSVVVVAAGVLFAAVAQGAFAAGWVIAFTHPLFALGLSMLGSLVIWARSGRQFAT